MSFLLSGRRADAIPDSGLLHDWEASNFDGSTWTDQEGSVDLSATGGPTLVQDAINGEPVVSFDSGDLFDGTGIDQSTPFVMFAVVDLVDNGEIQGLYSDSRDGEGGEPNLLYRFDSNESYRIVSGGSNFESTPIQSGVQINTFDYNGGSSAVRVNNSEIGTGTLSSDTLGDIRIGTQVGFSGRDFVSDIARILVYDRSQMATGQIADVEDSLNSIYGAY